MSEEYERGPLAAGGHFRADARELSPRNE
jgi:hypothetical protein